MAHKASGVHPTPLPGRVAVHVMCSAQLLGSSRVVLATLNRYQLLPPPPHKVGVATATPQGWTCHLHVRGIDMHVHLQIQLAR